MCNYMLLFAAPWVSSWVIAPAADPATVKACAGLCIDEFETLPLPLLPFPGWEQRARDTAITQWVESRQTLLGGSQPHALLVAMRNEAEQGRYFEGIDDGLLGFAEMGLLPPPPEQPSGWPGEEDAGAAAPPPPPTDGSALYPYLANLAVKAGARRLGLGKELVMATERKAAELGYERLYIKVDRQNFDARRVYDRLGYRIVYLQPRTDPRKGPPGANLFLRKDAKDGSFVVQAAAGDEEQGGGG
jgi:GNAT superfamily N-acetyltransferase